MKQKQTKAKKAKGKGRRNQLTVPKLKDIMSNTSAHVKLGSCTSDYARALANPVSGPLACIPDFPAQFSKKVRNWVKGTFSTGTNGFGGVTYSPHDMVTNDVAAVWFSKPGGIQTSFDTGTLANYGPVGSNSEYIATDFGVGATKNSYRIVSAVIRARYIGSELDRGGQFVGLTDPDHDSLATQTIAGMNLQETSKKVPVNREWFNVLYRPVNQSDLDFRTTVPVTTHAITDSDVEFMAIAVQAPSATSIAFEWEAYATFEIFGQNVRSMTVSHADASGFMAVHAISNIGNNLYPNQTVLSDLERKHVYDTAEYLFRNSSRVGKITSDDIHKTIDTTKKVVDTVTTVAPLVWDFLNFFF